VAERLAARRQGAGVTFPDFEAAIERVVGGLEQRSRVMNPRERQTVAYHECGHALDAEVRRIVEAQFERAAALLSAHRGAIGQLSAELLKAESLDGAAVREALSSAGRAVAS
jgi:ATP-dependent Zn protease